MPGPGLLVQHRGTVGADRGQQPLARENAPQIGSPRGTQGGPHSRHELADRFVDCLERVQTGAAGVVDKDMLELGADAD